MLFSLSPSAHQRACAWKQRERQSIIDSLPAPYSSPLSSSEEKIHSLSLAEIVTQCRAGSLAPADVMMTYAKRALSAQSSTNCLTDIMFEESLSTPAIAGWGPGVDTGDAASSTGSDAPRDRLLLLGVPVSIKDSHDIEGRDTTIGYSRNVGRPAHRSSAIVRLLQDAGAVIHAKTTCPTGLLGLETNSDVYGRTSNPYNTAFTPGASSGGGAAILACKGSKIEVGSDIGGSVRIPAHFCGIWSLKGSVGRFPSWGGASSLAGVEAVQLVSAPMATSLDDLEEFWKRVVLCEPWQYDHTCVPLPWRHVDLQQEGRKLKWGVMWDDGNVLPSPACRRALATVASALRQQGHEVVDFTAPDVSSGLRIGYQLLFADGGKQAAEPLQKGERVSGAAQAILSLFALPRIIKWFFAFLTRSSDPLTADLYTAMHPSSVAEERALVVARDDYRAQWHKKWIDEGLDFVLTVPHPLPAIEHGTEAKASLMSVGMTFLFNLLDYTAGVVPVTTVDKDVDALPAGFTSTPQYKALSASAKAAFSVYDADKMQGLPLGVQVIGRRFEEEKVLQGMRIVDCSLKDSGVHFQSLC